MKEVCIIWIEISSYRPVGMSKEVCVMRGSTVVSLSHGEVGGIDSLAKKISIVGNSGSYGYVSTTT